MLKQKDGHLGKVSFVHSKNEYNEYYMEKQSKIREKH